MANGGMRLVLRRDALRLVVDGGERCACAACARGDGWRPERCTEPSLSRDVMRLAAPLLDVMERARFELWLVILASAARAWNLEELRAANAEGVLEPFVLFEPGTSATLDAQALVEFLAERKRRLFPRDGRLVEAVRLAADGAFWCKPIESSRGVGEPAAPYVVAARRRAALAGARLPRRVRASRSGGTGALRPRHRQCQTRPVRLFRLAVGWRRAW